MFSEISRDSSFVHSVNLSLNPLAMDEFCLEDMETVVSEYEFAEPREFDALDNSNNNFKYTLGYEEEEDYLRDSIVELCMEDLKCEESTLNVSVY